MPTISLPSGFTRGKLSLGRFFVVVVLAVAAVVAGAFALFVRSARASILDVAMRGQETAAKRVEARVVHELGRAHGALRRAELGIRSGAIGTDDPAALDAPFFLEIANDMHLEEVTFTRATLLGYDSSGEALLAPEGRWQVSVYRAAGGAIFTRITRGAGDRFAVLFRERGVDGAFAAVPTRTVGSASDPTAHPTFSVIAAKDQRGDAIWSDLHWSELDQGLPESNRRVVLSVQKAVEDGAGRFVGVLRVGLETTELDTIAHARAEDAEPEARLALLAAAPDGHGVRLVARVDPTDRMTTIGDDLRIVSDRPPPEIAALLGSPLVQHADPEHPKGDALLTVAGEPWLATLREIDLGRGGTAGWMVAVLVPESRYTTELVRFERTFLVSFAVTLMLVLGIGAATLSAVRRGLLRIVRTTTRMRAFDFAAATETSVFREIDEVTAGLERAKTVVRAMGKYIPVDLVRRLYSQNREPELGGELLDVSLMFTDIEGFTTLSEKLAPDELARRLGDYLETMTAAIESTGGTIDKYIGDAVMAMWNAPTPLDGHAHRACRAALACMSAARALYASPAWSGLPPLVTRFGLHRARVMVGHFGAPARLAYTALGDGVNLAARLEPLCKQYGVTILVSEAIVAEARDAFVFRHVDRVAVKGKTEGIDVYELLGAVGDELPCLDVARRYEDAFDAYLARDFARAVDLLAQQADRDPPSAVLLPRCRELLASPPPAGWTGVHVATSK